MKAVSIRDIKAVSMKPVSMRGVLRLYEGSLKAL